VGQPGVTVAAPAPATDADLELVHDAPYVTAVEAVSRWAEHPDARDGLEGPSSAYARMFGLGTEDNPVFPGMHEASALVAGATLAAARAVWSGAAEHGASIAGGMHHAMAASRQRVRRLQRRGDRDRLAASAGRRAHRLRGHRRAPRRRGAGRVLRPTRGC
jgi:acetoin utilization deacetylase AcuC-like enzyme